MKSSQRKHENVPIDSPESVTLPESVTSFFSIENIEKDHIGRHNCSVGNCNEDATRKLNHAGFLSYSCAEDAHVERLADIAKSMEESKGRRDNAQSL